MADRGSWRWIASAADGAVERTAARWSRGTSSSARTPTRSARAGPRALDRAANSLQIATAPLPDALRRTILPGGEVLSDTRRMIRYWRMDDAGRLIMGGRGPFANQARIGLGASGTRGPTPLPRPRRIPFTHRWGGRVAMHADYLPQLHRPHAGLVAASVARAEGSAGRPRWARNSRASSATAATSPALPSRPLLRFPCPLKRSGSRRRWPLSGRSTDWD